MRGADTAESGGTKVVSPFYRSRFLVELVKCTKISSAESAGTKVVSPFYRSKPRSKNKPTNCHPPCGPRLSRGQRLWRGSTERPRSKNKPTNCHPPCGPRVGGDAGCLPFLSIEATIEEQTHKLPPALREGGIKQVCYGWP